MIHMTLKTYIIILLVSIHLLLIPDNLLVPYEPLLSPLTLCTLSSMYFNLGTTRNIPWRFLTIAHSLHYRHCTTLSSVCGMFCIQNPLIPNFNFVLWWSVFIILTGNFYSAFDINSRGVNCVYSRGSRFDPKHNVKRGKKAMTNAAIKAIMWRRE
jgi:hypothetical protein